MCGIAGVYLKGTPDRQKVELLLSGFERDLHHRGPDSSGVYVADRYGCVSRRLAIVGIAGGDQPIFDETGRYGIVYNGEVYNYRELRARYEARGARFHTATDTEVVLQAFIQEGVEGFARLEGMFALCVWDTATGEAWLARDPFGMKPLYLYEDGNTIMFASEMSALLAVSAADRALDPRGLADYLTFRYVNDPYTIFRCVRRVAAGSYVRVSAAGCRHYAIPRPSGESSESRLSYREMQEELRRLLLRSVTSHLIGEVPVALLLSGGVDSSILAALLHQADCPLECFNIGFPELNEFAYSSAMARHCGFQLNNVEVGLAELDDNFDRIVDSLDEPIADPAQFPLFLLFEQIKGFATVVLSGEGADEIFGGYPQYMAAQAPASLRGQFANFLRASYYFLDHDSLVLPPASDSDWRRTAKHFSGRSLLSAMSRYDLKTWLPENLMMKADKMAMRHSIEGRFPYLDPVLVSFVGSLPAEYLIAPDGRQKAILKDSFADLLPETVLSRPKEGFSVPIGALLHRWRERYFDTLDTLERRAFGDLLDLAAMRQNFADFLAGDESGALRNWTCLILASWLRSRFA